MSKHNLEFSDSANSSVEMEAASWVAQLDSDSMTDADRLALREWASRSPKHLTELRRIGEMWFDIDLMLEEQVARNRSKLSFIKFLRSMVRVAPKPFYITASVFCIALLGVFSTINLVGFSDDKDKTELVYSVPEGQNKQIELPDGSKVHINTNSIIEVAYSPEERIIRLTRGEAHFEVAHEVHRPFNVYAAGNVMRAVGTAFSVRLRSDETSLIVTEGKVKLAPLPREYSDNSVGSTYTHLRFEPTLVVAGQGVNVKNSEASSLPTILDISEETISNELAWRDGLIVFNGDSLEHAVEEISRYTRSRIIISDPSLRELPVGGVFEVGEVDALLGALEVSFDVEVKRVGDELIYLTSSDIKSTLPD